MSAFHLNNVLIEELKKIKKVNKTNSRKKKRI